MTSLRPVLLYALGVFAVLSSLASPAVSAAAPAEAVAASATSQMSQLTHARGDILPDGKVVVSFVATGDLRGLLTLTLTPAGDGSYGGQWALMVMHADNTDPQTGLEPELEEHHDGEPAHSHKDFLTLVHRGAVAGPVSGAVVVFGADGSVADVVANLTIGQGTLEFDGATGSGQATISSLTLLVQ